MVITLMATTATTLTLATILVGVIGISITVPTITTIGVEIPLAVLGVQAVLGATTLRATVVHAIATTIATPIPAEEHTTALCQPLLPLQEAVLVQVGAVAPLLQAVLAPTIDLLPQAAQAVQAVQVDLGIPVLALLDQVHLQAVRSQVLAQEEDNSPLFTYS